MDGLVCPKCSNPWRAFERSGITVDQCTGCRGVFLDRGELERLVDAEGSFYAQRGPEQSEAPYVGEHEAHRARYRDDDDDDYEHRHGYGGGHRSRRRRRGGFLEDFFGGDD